MRLAMNRHMSRHVSRQPIAAPEGIDEHVGDLSRSPVDEELVNLVAARIEHCEGERRHTHEGNAL